MKQLGGALFFMGSFSSVAALLGYELRVLRGLHALEAAQPGAVWLGRAAFIGVGALLWVLATMRERSTT